MIAPTRHLVLYLDSEPQTFSRGVLLLKMSGHAVIGSMDPEVSLRIFAVEPVTLVVICDTLEPGMRKKTIENLRGIRPDVPIVLLAKKGPQERTAEQYVDHVLHDDEPQMVGALIRRFTGSDPVE